MQLLLESGAVGDRESIGCMQSIYLLLRADPSILFKASYNRPTRDKPSADGVTPVGQKKHVAVALAVFL